MTSISGCSEMRGRSEGVGSGIEDRLAHPARRVPLDRLPAEWFHSIIALRCRGMRALADKPAVPGKLRGAWGKQLSLSASAEALAGRPCPWQPACAYDVFFRTQGHITPALEIPKPFVFGLFGDGADLVVRLTLFGFATDWTEAAAEALVRACRDTLSIDRPFDVTDRSLWSKEGVPAQEAPGALLLAFETPLNIRRKQPPTTRQQMAARHEQSDDGDIGFETIATNLANRVSGLTRWQDAVVDADFHRLKELARGCRTRITDPVPEGWRRFSRPQQRWIQMHGQRRLVLVEGDLSPFMPLLAIGETTHVGSRVSFGMGRYALLTPR
jgi:hypothetical protein